ncbi:MAG: DUF1295 domain-containing protein [Bacteriovoracaceae bacterium]|nr:DUF1295 domain-containing protein [Bacteriovoracaceae bacterium]
MMELVFVQLIFFNLFFLIGVLKNDFSTIDIGWGLSFLAVFLTGYFTGSYEASVRVLIVGALVALWAFRLSGYILLRSVRKGTEDYRYAQWRKDWGNRVKTNAYFRVYLLQAILSVIIASPLYLIHQFQDVGQFGNVKDITGLVLFIAGFLFESIADQQKSNFKQNSKNKNKIMRTGLWKYSRHPNYFGEALLWWGIFLIVINIVPPYYAFFGPLLLHFLLLKVSGVALLEKKYESNSEYEDYKKSTNSFIPFFTKQNEGNYEK